MACSQYRILLLRRACLAIQVVLLAGCAAQPHGKQPATPPAVTAVVAHGAVTSAEARVEKIGALLNAGVAPFERNTVPAYLDALEGRLRGVIAGNTAQIARVDAELVVVLPARVLFAPDAAELTPAGEKFLSALTDILRGEPALLVEAACHTDRLGAAADNESFSKLRADLVLATLAAHGLDSGRVIAVGSGDRFPIADNATADGRRQNRRVELSLIPIVR
jgi:outer membrane protein OmpA-like peptidoglycan-associated protein